MRLPACIVTISTHAPAGGATDAETAAKILLGEFLLTPLREGRRSTPGILPPGKIFLLTPLREGRHGQLPPDHQHRNFYSRPCGRGDDCRARWKVFKRTISTHAPAGGATIPSCRFGHTGRSISTHAPAGGATQRHVEANLRNDLISTHAPAGGATWSMP